MAAGALLVSGGSGADPQTPAGLPGMPPPFFGTTVVGSGGMTAAIDSYGDVVDLRARPGGRPLINDPSDRQAAGSVPSDTGIVPRVAIGAGSARPLWRADSVRQRYLPRTGVLLTVARFGAIRVTLADAATGHAFARRMVVAAPGPVRVTPTLGTNLEGGVRCQRRRVEAGLELACTTKPGTHRLPGGARLVSTAASADRGWLSRAKPLGPAAPAWAWKLYLRSLLILRALTDSDSGATIAGARDGWAFVWPRDAATAALALAASGYQPEAERVTRFLLGLDLEAAARFYGDGSPVLGRSAQGDAAGWVAVASRHTGIAKPTKHAVRSRSPAYTAPWRQRSDYREGGAGDFLANAIASGEPADRIGMEFGAESGLAREAGRQDAFDSAAAWAVRPFRRPALLGRVRRTLLRLASRSGDYGLLPGEDWPGGEDPWTAPTAWTAWSFAALGERREALRLLGDLRRAATPAGALPERVDAHSGVPRSITPLAWSHAFTILALLELWPPK